ncbi:hypothetical protein [Nocardioides sp. L-11A]|uniref:FitA-like ribbon-helix-helix domain-containing protein n=1 Tax=Nocardioides sp. L-11A TaxID=3043848 RepID=UPI00249C4F8F|nr:hypothetical protein QJ852_22540 [Nocardioides sp. L-11A]
MVALQIRDVPEEVRDVLALSARDHGQSLQAYLLDLVTREARFRQNVDIFHSSVDLRIELPPSDDPGSVVSIIREGRDGGFGIDRR